LLLPFYNMEIYKKIFNPSNEFGRGKRAPGLPRKRYLRARYCNVYNIFKETNNNISFESYTRMYLDEFKALINRIKIFEK